MANKYHDQGANPSKQTGGQGPGPKAQGSPASAPMPVKTANWPGLPGKAGPNRSGGDPTSGKLGPFYVKKEGL